MAFLEGSLPYGLAMDEVSPYETANPRGPSLEGTLSQQAAQTWGLGPSPAAGTGGFGTIDPVGSLGELQSQKMMQDEQQQPGIYSVKQDVRKGTTTLEVTNSALAEFMAQMTDAKQMKAAAMARVAQLRQQESSGSPILDALSQVAGGLAVNDPTMPGWVRALGATSLQLGSQGIKRERMVEEQRVLRLGQSIAEMQQVALANERAERQMALQEGRITAEQRDKELGRIQATIKDVGARYKDEVDKGRPIDPMLIATELAAGNVAPERAMAIARQMEAQSAANAKAAADAKAAEIRDKKDLEKYKADLDLDKSLTVEGRQHSYKMAELKFNRDTELEKIAEAAKTKSKTDKKLGAPQRETLTQINVLEEKLDNLAERAKKYKGTMGVIAGRYGNVVQNLPLVSGGQWAAERKAITAELQRNVAQYVRAVQGGGNTISNKDVENAAKALPTLNMSYEQFVALIDSVKDEGQYQRNAIKAAYEADWEGKDRNLLGVQKVDLPADFIEFLKKRPPGRGGEYNGKVYVIRDGAPVEVQ